MSTQLDSAFQTVVSDKSLSPDWLKALREKSYAEFSKLGYPTRQNEDWKYTSTRSLAETGFGLPKDSAAPSSALARASLKDANRLVFVNGVYESAQSNPPSDVSITSFNKLNASDRELVSSTFDTHDSLNRLNQAFFGNGIVIRVKKDADVKSPIQMLYLQSEASEASMISPRTVIILEKGSRAAFLESHYGESGHFTNAAADIFVEANAECRYILERVLRPQNHFVSSHNFHIERDARVESFNFALGGQLNRSHLTFRMKAPGASAKLDGLYLANDGSHIDNVTEVVHLAPNTSSAQLYKGILEGKSRAVFNGKITIVKDAQQVDAQQLNKNLLMSKDAEVDSRPQLVIDANDVKCSHGATIGQIDSQELFYLQSRAISKDDAKRMLAKAFIGDVLNRIQGQLFQDHLENTLENFGSRV